MKTQNWLALLGTLSSNHDPYENAHSTKTVELVERLAREFDYPEADLPDLRLGTELHDIGKLLVSERILNKKGKLTTEEWAALHRHVEIGYSAVLRLGAGPIVGNIVYQHHERMNGTGYPRGLLGKDIALEARMVGICDCYDALTSPRSYRDALAPDDALDVMFLDPGFDPTLLAIFSKVVQP